MGKGIKAIIFDLDDTLYDYKTLDRKAEQQLKEYFLNMFHMGNQEFQDIFYRAKQIVKSRLRGTGAEHNRLLYFQTLLELLRQKPVSCALELYDIYWNTILEGMALREGASGVLKLCREHGLSIGICSDLTAMIQHRKLKRLGLENQVDYLVTSEEAGAEKPSPVIFNLLLSKVNCQASECMFVGDSWERDICGAKNVGMMPVWFHTSNAAQEEVLQIRDFYQLEWTIREHI